MQILSVLSSYVRFILFVGVRRRACAHLYNNVTSHFDSRAAVSFVALPAQASDLSTYLFISVYIYISTKYLFISIYVYRVNPEPDLYICIYI